MKMNRNDIVRLCVAKLQAAIAAELEEAQRAEFQERATFRQVVQDGVLSTGQALLNSVVAAVGSTRDRLAVDVNLEPTDDHLAHPPADVPITIRDDIDYAARVVLRMRLLLWGDQPAALLRWFEAVKRVRTARARSVRVGALGDAARAEAVQHLLESLPEGAAVLAAMQPFVQALSKKEFDTPSKDVVASSDVTPPTP